MSDPAGGASVSSIRTARDGAVGTITIDRPPLNVLDIDAFDRLAAALATLTREGGVDVLVIRAAGDRAFSAGADVAEHSPDLAPGMLASFHRVARFLWSTDAVSIAVIRGPALGAGMELALCCDMVVASEEASFGQPEIHVGSFPPIAAALLPRLLGRQRAADIVLTGRRLSAFEALAIGIVTRIAPPGGLEEEVSQLIESLTASSAPVMRTAVRALRGPAAAAFSDALAATERIYLQDLLALEDAREGVAAFLEKRRPRWQSGKKGSPGR